MRPRAFCRRAIAGVLASMVAVASGACARDLVMAPAELDTQNDTCASCRMGVVDRGFAAQLVAPGEEPLFFDDIGCLRDYLSRTVRVPPGAIAYVADHRTRRWVRATAAVYTRVPGLHTPMGSGLIAHADAASRRGDEDARRGVEVTVLQVFGPRGLPRGLG